MTGTKHVNRIELVRWNRELKHENKELRMIVRELLIEEGKRIELNNNGLYERARELLRIKQ